MNRWAPLLAWCCFLAGCSAASPPQQPAPTSTNDAVLFDAATALDDGWHHLRLVGETDYRLVPLDGAVAFRAVPDDSASGLIRRVDVEIARCPIVEWTWFVPRVQQSANLRSKRGDDVAASVLLLFGDPGFLFDPRPVPTLRYVWTNAKPAANEVVDNPYLPGIVRSIVVRRGAAGALHRWVTERRNVLEDYRRAFGRPPSDNVRAVVLFSDNDQTGEPTEAYFGSGKAHCKS